MNKEELLKAIMELPNIETDNPISTMTSVNVDDLMSAIDRLNKVTDYNDLLKENQELKKQLSIKTLQLEEVKLSKRDYTQENILEMKLTLKENQQKEFISYLEKTIEELESDDVDDEEMKGYLIQRIDTFKEILSKYKEITGDDK